MQRAPRRNRVDPQGVIFAHPARGLFMGNRGVLHGDQGQIRRSFGHKSWICCLTAFKGRQRPLMQPGRYTELFFLDEPTALAAGHRPCATCRPHRYHMFVQAWLRAHGLGLGAVGRPRAAHMDDVLHRSRLAPRPLHHATALPDGVMLLQGRDALLIWQGAAHPWRPDGYGPPNPLPDTPLPLLTAPAMVDVIRAGYAPETPCGFG